MVAIKRLSTVDADFQQKLASLLAFEAAADESIERTVAGILADVKARGDAAVVEYTNKFDRLTATSMADLELSKAEMQKALDGLPADRRRLDLGLLVADHDLGHLARGRLGPVRQHEAFLVERLLVGVEHAGVAAAVGVVG